MLTVTNDVVVLRDDGAAWHAVRAAAVSAATRRRRAL